MDWINPVEEEVASDDGVLPGGSGAGEGDAANFSAAAPSFEFSNKGNKGNVTTLRIKKDRRLADEDFRKKIS
ncbi:hypothetical protein SGGMMB4_02202 [Sodalis glossinidius str. 'morsitans']|uniref:Uncharacterized protein n=2 Tax=Sodalis glossinidius TaxID=63612 RepID=A0A193QIA7_SODGM|nr:hypothetical protein SGGMMB4_02202 [Sodalis glossinidius str. 'morsitans']